MSCCANASCSHTVMAAASVECTQLTDKERDIILGVLTRDELLRREQQTRVMHLKAELQTLRRKGALRPSADFDGTGSETERTCGRCRTELGRVINRGAYCRACRHKVCKGCREYSFRTTDWVCTVCHKRMEIQAASGEWMNEFVRRPSRRRDNKVYVPAADIIKRTIRRSWTISNPTSRWNALRGSPELRPYNSLPRDQDINNFPSLALRQTNLKNQELKVNSTSPFFRRKSPTRRTQSEDVYAERDVVEHTTHMLPMLVNSVNSSGGTHSPERLTRVNPLIKYAQTNQKEKDISAKRKQEKEEEGVARENKDGVISEQTRLMDKRIGEKRISINSNKHDRFSVNKSGRSNSQVDDPKNGEQTEMENTKKVHATKEEPVATALELCDIEPISGTVFRKVTVRRRSEKFVKVPAVDASV